LDGFFLAPLGPERADLLADLDGALALVPVGLVDGGPDADVDAYLLLAPQVAQVAAGRDVDLADGDVVVARLLQALEAFEPLRHRRLALPRRILGTHVVERLLPGAGDCGRLAGLVAGLADGVVVGAVPLGLMAGDHLLRLVADTRRGADLERLRP